MNPDWLRSSRPITSVATTTHQTPGHARHRHHRDEAITRSRVRQARRCRVALRTSTRPASIEIGMIGVDHGQPPEKGLLRVDVAIFTLCEVPIDAP